VLSSLIAPSCPVTVRRLPPSTGDACLYPIDINADLGSETIHHLPAEEFKLCGPGRLVNLHHEHAVFKANGSHVPRDKVTDDLLPPAEEASNLTTIRTTQALENAIEGLRQRGEFVVHVADRNNQLTRLDQIHPRRCKRRATSSRGPRRMFAHDAR
jgi:hypothetical protein